VGLGATGCIYMGKRLQGSAEQSESQ
jgi:hypothetical protein